MNRTEFPLTGEPIRSMQTFLRKISERRDIPKVVTDGIFGGQTKDAVMAFQRLYKLKPTGEADKETWDKIVEIFDEVTKETAPPDCLVIFPESGYIIEAGSEDRLLYVLQAALKGISENVENVPGANITGVHDEASVAAVKSIQKISGMEETGRIDKDTSNAIAEVYQFFVVKSITPPETEYEDYPGSENKREDESARGVEGEKGIR